MANIKITKLSRASLAGAVLLIAAGLLISATQARAETDKCRVFGHTINAERVEVGDVPDHVIGIAENKGLAFFENGEVATLSEAHSWDSTKGKGTNEGYMLFTFEDGSNRVAKFQGKFDYSVAEEGKPASFEGTYTYVRGSGRFEGIQGSGSLIGKDFGEAGGYFDLTGTYTLP